jgi:uncharacterized protein (DUF885 family)
MMRAVFVLAAFLLGGCRKEQVPVPVLAEEFVYQSLAFSPVSATFAGYHRHAGTPLDELLDDYSEQGLQRRRAFYRGMMDRLARVNPGALSVQDRADYDILTNQTNLALLELDTIQSYRTNPTLYVELVGNGLFGPYSLEYAAPVQRFRHIISRMEKIPALLGQARRNLTAAPEIWNRVARQENEGNIALIDKTLRAACPAALKDDFDRAARTALDALRDFNVFLSRDLAGKTADWRLGGERYARKFRHTLGTSAPPERLLADAEAMLTEVRRQMFQIALPLHNRFYPQHKDPVDLNLIVGETLDKIAQKRSTPAAYFADARRDLEEARRFVREKQLLPLPPRDNLQVIETPEFMRGIYAVGGFSPAPALEPHLGAHYWLTPIPPDWPKERIESKLREYNFYGLKLLTLHEAIPGHYVQFEYANDLEPKYRRLLRSVFGSGTYVEGWAVYSTEAMLDAGYLDHSPELRLTFLKQQLRMIANAILDIRLHTMGMTDEQAMDLMINKTFQEKEEASAKLQRAKLSSCQLPTYFAGWRDWRRLLDLVKRERGAAFRLSAFHEEALKQSAVPLPSLARILTGKDLD